MPDIPRTPMDLMKELAPEAAGIYLDHKTAVMENPELSALPPRTKLLVGIGGAAALQSSVGTLMWTKLARQAGANNAEIAEAIAVARLMKSATVNDPVAEAVIWLLEHPRAANDLVGSQP